MNPIALVIKEKRKQSGLTKEQFSIRSGLGLLFIRELEQGKTTVSMDKINIALSMFNMEAIPSKKEGTKWVYFEQPMSTLEILLREH